MMTREEAIDKAQKLMALGESSNEHEAASAIAMATALLERYEIEMSDLGVDEGEEIEEASFRMHTGTSKIYWKRNLAQVLAHSHGASVFFRGSRVILVGKPTDMAPVEKLYWDCMKEVERLARKKCPGKGKSFAHSFRLGVVSAIEQAIARESASLRRKIRAERAAAGKEISEVALMVVDNRRAEAQAFRNKAHPGLSTPKGPMNRTWSGFSAGVVAGKNVYGAASRTKIHRGE